MFSLHTFGWLSQTVRIGTQDRDDVKNVTAIRSIGYPVFSQYSEFAANWVPYWATVQIQDGATGVIGPASPERYFGTKYENSAYGHIRILSEYQSQSHDTYNLSWRLGATNGHKLDEYYIRWHPL